ncbi:threonine-phosphate decarboxylase CobD [Halalkalibacterium ligniniphilum]|uniref:threonine-phosphate decarboxylase CobD n=1 Tax=Halalkalibacterium ligniniphilum TaxID=1134413 RepID=UPI000349ADE9|nr:threonine-phosphate decarboxylase CobD [Halalkalibacterium ligniniphilum]
MSLPNHGANPQSLMRALGLPYNERSLDFSVNTNPFGPPETIKERIVELLPSLYDYPDPEALRLRQKIASIEKVEPEAILIGNGAAQLIFLLAQHFRKKRVLIIEPAFSEYRDACEANECEVTGFVLQEPWQLDPDHLRSQLEKVDVLFLCQPNNPTGSMMEPNRIERLIQLTEKTGTTLVMDEAFYDFMEHPHSFANRTSAYEHLVVLRSMTKMFAIPGARLGYAVSSPSIIANLKRHQPPWSVNGLAQEIGLLCLEETLFVQRTVQAISKERQRVKRALEELGFQVSESVVNFYLISEPKKGEMISFMTYLIQQGIIPRHTNNFAGLDGHYLRLAVKDLKSNDQLLDVVAEWRR